MLKTAAPPERSTSERLKVSNGKSSDSIDGVKIAKKLEKSKGQKLSKSQKPAKTGKNLLKSGNSPNFDAKDSGPSFLTPKARAAFNDLRLTFTKAPILWYFDLKCHI